MLNRRVVSLSILDIHAASMRTMQAQDAEWTLQKPLYEERGMESGFRIVVAVLIATALGISFFFYVKTGKAKDVLYGEKEGGFLALIRSLLFILAMASLLIYILMPAWMSWASWHVPVSIRLFGIFAATVSIVSIFRVHSILGRNFSASLRIRDGHTLVTYGPYRWVRHPLYTAWLIFFSSLFLITANWVIGILGVSLEAFVMLIRTGREEAMLQETFGDQYREYMARTGRFFPRIPGVFFRESKRHP